MQLPSVALLVGVVAYAPTRPILCLRKPVPVLFLAQYPPPLNDALETQRLARFQHDRGGFSQGPPELPVVEGGRGIAEPDTPPTAGGLARPRQSDGHERACWRPLASRCAREQIPYSSRALDF